MSVRKGAYLIWFKLHHSSSCIGFFVPGLLAMLRRVQDDEGCVQRVFIVYLQVLYNVPFTIWLPFFVLFAIFDIILALFVICLPYFVIRRHSLSFEFCKRLFRKKDSCNFYNNNHRLINAHHGLKQKNKSRLNIYVNS